MWKIAEGKFSKIPEEFNSEIQVPGFVDMARPAFKDVGAKTLKERGLKPHYPVDSLREAFWYRRDFDFKMLTELWRTSRKNAGVLHFCMLGYSREGGATCDNFIDVKRQIFEPHFKKYASDAFAPVGLMLDYFETPAKASSSMKLKVKFINDTYEDFKGTLQLSLCDSKGKVLFESRKPLSSAACGKGELSFELKIPDSAGKYEMCAKILETGTESRRTLVVEN